MSGIAIGSTRLGRVLHAVRATGRIARKVFVQQRPLLMKFLRASPVAVALLVGLCGVSAAALFSFGLMMLPAWRWSALAGRYGFTDDAPAGRALCFLVCLLAAWLAGGFLKALDLWWERLRRPEQAELKLAGRTVDLRSLLRRTARTAAEFYVIAFWIMAAVVGLLLTVNAARDPIFEPTAKLLTSMLAGYLGAAAGTILLETSRLPPAFGLPAGLLFISFFFFGCWKLMRSGGK